MNLVRAWYVSWNDWKWLDRTAGTPTLFHRPLEICPVNECQGIKLLLNSLFTRSTVLWKSHLWSLHLRRNAVILFCPLSPTISPSLEATSPPPMATSPMATPPQPVTSPTGMIYKKLNDNSKLGSNECRKYQFVKSKWKWNKWTLVTLPVFWSWPSLRYLDTPVSRYTGSTY